MNAKYFFILILFSSVAFSDGDPCDLYRQFKLKMSMDQVKTIVGSQYPLTLTANTYTWDLPGKVVSTDISFNESGAFINAMGSIPDQISQSIANKTLTLANAQQILGAGKVSGQIYSIKLNNNKLINISTDLNNQVYALDANISCP